MAHQSNSARACRLTSQPVKPETWKKRARIAFLTCLALQIQSASLDAQPPRADVPPSSKPTKPASPAGAGAVKTPPAKGEVSKLSEKEKRAERARELFADAANAQNNAAYTVAVDNWKKLLEDYPNDALASSAHHFLGICYLQQDKPEFGKAISEFKLALQDKELKHREESLVNLGWSLYQNYFLTHSSGADDDTRELQEAVMVLRVAIDEFPDGGFLDKALFYTAEAEARLGKSKDAVDHYRQLIQNRKLESSSVRADALFGLGLTFEEMKQPKLALEYYQSFLEKYADHSQADEVKLRAADLALTQGDAAASLPWFESLAAPAKLAALKNADYVLYRYGFALAKLGKFNESAEIYKLLSEKFPDSQYSKNSSLAAGQALMREKKYDEAVRAFEQLLPIKDDRAAEAAHWICQLKTIQGKISEVAPFAKQVLAWAAKTPSAPLLQMDLADSLNAIPATRSEAKAVYEKIATEFPDDPIAPRATYNAAFCSLQLGALADAQRWSEAFAKRYGNDPLASDVAYIRAESTLQLGQFESAMNAFEQLIASQPSDPLQPTWQARLCVAQYLGGQFDKAISLSKQLLQKNLDADLKAEVLYLQGASYLKLSKYSDAISALKLSLESSKRWAQADEAFIALSESYAASQKNKEALQTLEDFLKVNPGSRLAPQANFRSGQLAAATGDWDRANLSYDQVLANAKDKNLLDYASYGKAFVFIQGEKFQEALPLLEPLTVGSRTDTIGIEAKIAKAICLRQLQRFDESIKTLDSLSTVSMPEETKTKVTYELALSQGAAGRYDDAIAKWNDLIQNKTPQQLASLPFADKSLYELAWAYKSKGDSSKAMEQFERLISVFPDSPLAAEAYFHVGQVEYESSKFDKAIRAYQVAATKSLNSELQEKSMYKLGWAFFQQGDFKTAESKFRDQIKEFANGPLLIDGKFMLAECRLKQFNYADSLREYEDLRKLFKSAKEQGDNIPEQVQSLTLLHGGQSARELKKWKDAEAMTSELVQQFPESTFKPIALYELAYARQNLKKIPEAIAGYGEVADNYRNELGARSRFMIGELLFSERDFAKAISEFQKVMYGYGATQAPDEIKNWQARSAFEAGRCSEVLIEDLTGDRRQKGVETAVKFYDFVAKNHPGHELHGKAMERIAALSK